MHEMPSSQAQQNLQAGAGNLTLQTQTYPICCLHNLPPRTSSFLLLELALDPHPLPSEVVFWLTLTDSQSSSTPWFQFHGSASRPRCMVVPLIIHNLHRTPVNFAHSSSPGATPPRGLSWQTLLLTPCFTQ